MLEGNLVLWFQRWVISVTFGLGSTLSFLPDFGYNLGNGTHCLCHTLKLGHKRMDLVIIVLSFLGLRGSSLSAEPLQLSFLGFG